MSYCRFSDGDVYMYPRVDGGIECCACSLRGCNGMQIFYTYQDALDHLYEHRAAEHEVPEYAIERLKAEIEAGLPLMEDIYGVES